MGYSGGSFEVCFRPGGHFFCPSYQALANYQLHDGGKRVAVDWKGFGQYELTSEDGKSWAGSLVGKPEDWRKATFLRPLSDVELLLLGEGEGSEWNFSFEGGSFKVTFKADGYNHFRCAKYPAHSHWAMPAPDTVFIDWNKYGKYELKMDVATQSMTGSVQGKPEHWRK